MGRTCRSLSSSSATVSRQTSYPDTPREARRSRSSHSTHSSIPDWTRRHGERNATQCTAPSTLTFRARHLGLDTVPLFSPLINRHIPSLSLLRSRRR
ncbi:hypothetical protein Cob_v005908 [Colletotrichum orbiculare MAFF 240422]|uniref:Uncharacterized protein n=1 Tax=Colletotrichum orbiculare (strain 104-T / ATCC 96160 / CBS 514.97 / LARS 414 / MAFF 240422) TaxID=1213857 RepID=A0A484FUK9_COLOR|nr:hypothetical protein Cob_v005908 [Colletotrichum orbiculare MAFF 240422]